MKTNAALNTFPPRQQCFLRAYAATLGNLSEAAKMAGVPRRTVYNWMNNDEQFENARSLSVETALDFAESMLFEKIRKGNVRAIIFFLKTRGKSRGYC